MISHLNIYWMVLPITLLFSCGLRVPCLYAPSFSMGLIVTFIVVILETYESLKILTQSSEVKMISVKLSVIWAGLFHPVTLLSNSK